MYKINRAFKMVYTNLQKKIKSTNQINAVKKILYCTTVIEIHLFNS